MKKLLLALILSAASLAAEAQKLVPATAAEQERIVARINAAAASMTSMECSFTQTKQLKMLNDKMVSKGRMLYKQGNRLRWEYLSPYTYVFVLNGSKVMLDSGKSRNVIDVKTNRLFESIARIMMNSVTGKCLTDKSEFKVTLYKQGDDWVADLQPLKKQMRQMFSRIRLHFDTRKMVVDSVTMYEKSGDNTVIRLQNVRKNQPINACEFKIG